MKDGVSRPEGGPLFSFFFVFHSSALLFWRSARLLRFTRLGEIDSQNLVKTRIIQYQSLKSGPNKSNLENIIEMVKASQVGNAQ